MRTENKLLINSKTKLNKKIEQFEIFKNYLLFDILSKGIAKIYLKILSKYENCHIIIFIDSFFITFRFSFK